MKIAHSFVPSLLMLIVLPAYGATSIVDTVFNIDGTLARGYMVARISQACSGPASKFISRTGKRVKIIKGVLDIDLEPNDTCTPAETTYSIKFTLQEGSWEETWSVATSTPDLTRADVITDTTVEASVSVGLTQISGGTTKGDLIAYSGTSFARLGVGSNGSILFADSSEALGLNWGDLSWDKTNLMLRGGGVTASFPAWKRVGAGWEARTANDGGDTTVKGSILNAVTGFRVNGAATSAQFLRGNGTNFVDAAIAAGDLPTAIDAAKLADGTVSNAEYQRLDGLSADIQGQFAGKEGTLTNSAGLKGALSDEIGTGVAVFPTFTSVGNNEILVYETGELVNQTLAEAGIQPLDADLTAVAALASTGLVARTGAATYAERTVTGTANEVTVSNGDGVSGNPTLGLATGIDAAKIGGGGVSTAEFNRLGSVSSNVQDQFDAKITVFNVKAYGATGNMTSDDSDEIQAAIDAAEAAGGGIVYFPKGGYKLIANGLTVNSPYVVLQGEGSRSTQLRAGANDLDLLAITSTTYTQVRNLGFNGLATTGVKAINGLTASYSVFNNILFEGTLVYNFYMDRGRGIDVRDVIAVGDSVAFFGSTTDGGANYMWELYINGWNVAGATGAAGPLMILQRLVGSYITGVRTASLGDASQFFALRNDCQGVVLDNNTLVNGTIAVGLERTTVGGTTTAPSWTTISNLMCDQFETSCIDMEQDSFQTVISNLLVANMGGAATAAVIARAGCGGANLSCFQLGNSNLRGIGTKGVLVEAAVSSFIIHGNYFDAGGGETAIEIAADASDSYVIQGNIFEGAGTYLTDGGTGTEKQIYGNTPNLVSVTYKNSANVASQTTTTLPVGNLFHITGTNNITTLNTCDATNNGRLVTLIFDAILDFTDGNNLKLAGTFTTSADDVIQLICDGSNWYQAAPESVN